MASQLVIPSYPVFTEADGDALEDGYINIGITGLNPLANPQQAYWDAALTIPAAQPIRTIGGYPSRDGSPSNIFVANSDYSLMVRDKRQRIIYSLLSAENRQNNAINVIYTPGFPGATPRPLDEKLEEIVSVLDFSGVDETGVLDSTAGLQVAADNSNALYWPRGQYKFTTISLQGRQGVRWYGEAKSDRRYDSGYEAPTVLICTATGNGIDMDNAGTGTDRTDFITFEDFILVRESSPRLGQGFTIANTNGSFHGHVAFNNVGIYGFATGIKAGDVNPVGWISLNDCNIQNCGWGVDGNINVFNVSGGSIYQNGGLGLGQNLRDLSIGTSNGGIKIKCKGGSINGCDLENNGVGVYLYGSSCLSITGCYFEEHPHMAALVVDSLATFTSCYSNNSIDADTQDMFVFQSSRVSLRENISFTFVQIGGHRVDFDTATAYYISDDGADINDWQVAPYNKFQYARLDEIDTAIQCFTDAKALDIAEFNASITQTNATKTLNTSVSTSPFGLNSISFLTTATGGIFKVPLFANPTAGGVYSITLAFRNCDFISCEMRVVNTIVARSVSLAVSKFDGISYVTLSGTFSATVGGLAMLWVYPNGGSGASGSTLELLAFTANKYKNKHMFPRMQYMVNDAAPTAGGFSVGAKVFHSAPVAGGTVGWVCTTDGTPGTWKTFGTIAP